MNLWNTIYASCHKVKSVHYSEYCEDKAPPLSIFAGEYEEDYFMKRRVWREEYEEDICRRVWRGFRSEALGEKTSKAASSAGVPQG